MRNIIPGIQEQTFEAIENKFHLVEPYIDWIQIDVTDQTLTSNHSFQDAKAFDKLTPLKNFEVHLMTKNTSEIYQNWINAGFKRIIAHVESDNPENFINAVKGKAEVGLALDGPSPIDLLYPFLEKIDSVLIMMYKAGPSGQAFQNTQLTKIRNLRKHYPSLPIEVDGGINADTIDEVEKAGANRFVVTSAIFNSDNIENAVKKLQGVQ